MKKAEAYNAVKQQYPNATTQFNDSTVQESNLNSTPYKLTATPSAGTGITDFKYEYCIAGTTAPTTSISRTGALITYYDYVAGSAPTVTQLKMGITTQGTNGTDWKCTVAS